MKKIASILAVMTIASFIACNESSGPSTETGYVDPGLGSTKPIINEKSYIFADSDLPDCSGSNCGSIIYQGSLNGTYYTGIAIGKDSLNPNFSLKIYWNSTSISSINTTDYTIIVTDGSNTYSTTSDNLNIAISSASTIASDSSTVTYYTIVFNENITVNSTYNIQAGETIVAYKYP